MSDYTNGWPDLESVVKDVEEVSAALEGQGFNVVRVLDPTKRELSAAFGDFIGQYGYDAENRLLFYYSGHGVLRHSFAAGKRRFSRTVRR